MKNTLSYVCGERNSPLMNVTLGEYFDQVAGANADRLALVVRHQSVRWTYGQLQQRITALAASLVRLGLMPGERIGIWSQNCAEWVVTQFATAKAGLVLVNINPAYRCAELGYALRKAGCKALILAPRFKTSDYLGMLQEVVPELGRGGGELRSAALPNLEYVIGLGTESTPGMLNFDDLLTAPSAVELAGLAARGAQLNCNEPINIQFTSGTTGAPKGATLTHRNLLNNGFFVGAAMRLGAADRVCIPVPLYHCFGMVVGNLACVTHAAAMVFPGEIFNAGETLETIHSERCTAVHGVPTMFIAMLEYGDFARFDLSRLRTGVMAGSPCPIEVMRSVMSRMHLHEMTIAYGMTETAPISFQSSIDDPVERRVSFVGRVQPHLEVKIVDSAGEMVPRGTAGELLTRGYSVMLGYWGDEEKTREAVDSEGWMHTGDLATLDAEGFCNIVGRSKDMVIRGGENIFPREIEEFLYGHPKVRDVQVIGVPDAKYGEEVCACIILRPGVESTAAEIRDFCRGRIAHFKVPRYVRFMAAFPMTVTGKIPKYLLRQQMAGELGLREVATA